MRSKTVSLPHLSLLTEDGEERSLGGEELEDSEAEDGRGLLSPLAPRLTPTGKGNNHEGTGRKGILNTFEWGQIKVQLLTGSSQSLSPFWLTETSRELSQIPGATSSSWNDPAAPDDAQSPAFSLLHAAAITGDVEGDLNDRGGMGTSVQVLQS